MSGFSMPTDRFDGRTRAAPKRSALDCGHDRLLQKANSLKEHARKALPCISDAEKAKKLSEAIFAYMEARDGA